MHDTEHDELAPDTLRPRDCGDGGPVSPQSPSDSVQQKALLQLAPRLESMEVLLQRLDDRTRVFTDWVSEHREEHRRIDERLDELKAARASPIVVVPAPSNGLAYVAVAAAVIALGVALWLSGVHSEQQGLTPERPCGPARVLK
jgi:hypothetical protein